MEDDVMLNRQMIMKNQENITKLRVDVGKLAVSYDNMKDDIKEIHEAVNGNLTSTLLDIQKSIQTLDRKNKISNGNTFTKKLDSIIPPNIRSFLWLWFIRVAIGGASVSYILDKNIPK